MPNDCHFLFSSGSKCPHSKHWHVYLTVCHLYFHIFTFYFHQAVSCPTLNNEMYLTVCHLCFHVHDCHFLFSSGSKFPNSQHWNVPYFSSLIFPHVKLLSLVLNLFSSDCKLPHSQQWDVPYMFATYISTLSLMLNLFSSACKLLHSQQ